MVFNRAMMRARRDPWCDRRRYVRPTGLLLKSVPVTDMMRAFPVWLARLSKPLLRDEQIVGQFALSAHSMFKNIGRS